MKKSQTPKSFLAIDPGKYGGLAVVDIQHAVPEFSLCEKMPKTERATNDLIKEMAQSVDFVFIENINGWMGKFLPSSRMFTMGYWFGVAMSAAVANNPNVSKVMAHKWQKDLGCDAKSEHPDLPKKAKRTGKESLPWKDYLHFFATQLYPEASIHKQVADAVLIATWAATQYRKKNPL